MNTNIVNKFPAAVVLLATIPLLISSCGGSTSNPFNGPGDVGGDDAVDDIEVELSTILDSSDVTQYLTLLNDQLGNDFSLEANLLEDISYVKNNDGFVYGVSKDQHTETIETIESQNDTELSKINFSGSNEFSGTLYYDYSSLLPKLIEDTSSGTYQSIEILEASIQVTNLTTGAIFILYSENESVFVKSRLQATDGVVETTEDVSQHISVVAFEQLLGIREFTLGETPQARASAICNRYASIILAGGSIALAGAWGINASITTLNAPGFAVGLLMSGIGGYTTKLATQGFVNNNCAPDIKSLKMMLQASDQPLGDIRNISSIVAESCPAPLRGYWSCELRNYPYCAEESPVKWCS